MLLRRHWKRAGATVSALLLLLLPILIVLMFFAWNVGVINHQRAAQEAASDACALAAGQALVNDLMLYGTPSNVDDLQDLASTVAQYYATLNPLPPGPTPAAPLVFGDNDIVFTLMPNPLDASLSYIDTVTVTGQRSQANGRALSIFGGQLFGSPSLNVVTPSKVMLDRRVVGLRPVFDTKNIPVAPIAIANATWIKMVEASSPPGNLTVTVALPDAAILCIGATSESDLLGQLSDGIEPVQLADFGGQFVLDPLAGLSVPLFSAVDPRELKSTLQGMAEDGKPRVWPLFTSVAGGSAQLNRLVAARVSAIADTTDPSTGAAGVKMTLQPSFFSAPSVLTSVGRDINPYLCRVHLSN